MVAFTVFCAPFWNATTDAYERGDMAWIQKPLSDIIENQQIIYDYLKESFNSTNQSISKLSNISVSNQAETNIVDEKEQKRLQLQSQIDALQDEIANL